MNEYEKRGRVRMMLWSWGQTMELIGRKREEMEALSRWAEDAADTLAARRLTGMPAGGAPGDSVGRAVAELESRREMFASASAQAKAEIEAMLERKRAMDALIAALTATEQRVLALRYAQAHKWTYIALKMNYSERGVKGHENAAVCRLARMIELQDG